MLPPDDGIRLRSRLRSTTSGEVWAAVLWDMRELLIMKDPNGVFFDGNRRLGSGTTFYIGSRPVQSVDTQHPINYRASFGTTNGTTPTINAATHIVRPGLVANEIAANSTAVAQARSRRLSQAARALRTRSSCAACNSRSAIRRSWIRATRSCWPTAS